MISYKTLRYIASISVGVVVMIGTFAFLWAFTKISLPAILFWCLITYSIGIAVMWYLSTPQKREPVNKAPIVNLRKEDWR